MYDLISGYYKMGLYDASDLQVFVDAKYITVEESTIITQSGNKVIISGGGGVESSVINNADLNPNTISFTLGNRGGF